MTRNASLSVISFKAMEATKLVIFRTGVNLCHHWRIRKSVMDHLPWWNCSWYHYQEPGQAVVSMQVHVKKKKKERRKSRLSTVLKKYCQIILPVETKWYLLSHICTNHGFTPTHQLTLLIYKDLCCIHTGFNALWWGNTSFFLKNCMKVVPLYLIDTIKKL